MQCAVAAKMPNFGQPQAESSDMSEAFDRLAYDPARHQAEVLAWRRARLARLTAPDSWLSLVGKLPLITGDNSVGAADGCDVPLPRGKAPERVGCFTLQERVVTFTPAPGVALTLQRAA